LPDGTVSSDPKRIPPWMMSVDGMEIVMATNHMGHFGIWRDLQPIVEATAKAHGHATIVHVSSQAAMLASSLHPGVPTTLEEILSADRYHPGIYLTCCSFWYSSLGYYPFTFSLTCLYHLIPPTLTQGSTRTLNPSWPTCSSAILSRGRWRRKR
jgi:hypothetical protein